MYTVLLVIHALITLALIVVVLLQRSEGGALGIGGGGGGMGGFMTARGTANVLTRATMVLAAAFFALSLLIAWYGVPNRQPRSFVDQPAATGTTAPQVPTPSPATPAPGSQAPAAPAPTPAPPAAPAPPIAR